MIKVKGTEESETCVRSEEKPIAEMAAYHEEPTQAVTFITSL